MKVKYVKIENFRNLESCQINLSPGINILLGENAQGKSNFLEAIEFLATAKTMRANHDSELIKWKEKKASVEICLIANNNEDILKIELKQTGESQNQSKGRLQKTIKINDVVQPSARALMGRLIPVSFTSYDMNLLRGGPKYRRDWLDMILLKVSPGFFEIESNYEKVVSQRNRLLKTLFERGRVSVADQDELVVWDKQLCLLAGKIIKKRIQLIDQLLPIAKNYQNKLSNESEELSVNYLFKMRESKDLSGQSDDTDNLDSEISLSTKDKFSKEELLLLDEIEIAKSMFKLLKDYRFEEIRRKQSLIGPHRDDIVFYLNDAEAATFGSQGQQRSIVLALKLAELEYLTDKFGESPVLLLDDVLAELDTKRQKLLIESVNTDKQTIITTTHLSHFSDDYLSQAHLLNVNKGQIKRTKEEMATTS
jgi:DNA replication and repair protein RecF